MSSNLKVFPPKPSSPPPWYADGIRFACTCSGKCCTAHGEYEYVFYSREEERGLANSLGLSVREFRKRHTKRAGALQRSLRFPGGKCTFLEGNRCAVYDVRPRQCRTWPFWAENMNKDRWDAEVASFCPGIGRGRRYTREEIERVMEDRAEVTER